MGIDFFKEDCLTVTNERKFGICDGLNDAKAFIDFKNGYNWICTILNGNEVKLSFRAIDYCVVILKKDGNQERSCDCMLTYPNNIIFIELKNKGKSWMEDGINQIEKTLSHFILNHNLDEFKHKRAFVANKKHPHFHIIENEIKRRFYSIYRVRLNVQAEIAI